MESLISLREIGKVDEVLVAERGEETVVLELHWCTHTAPLRRQT